MTSISKQLNQYFGQALVNAFGIDFAEIDPLVILASNPKFGDYQSNIALVLAKKLGEKPRDIAKKIIDNLELEELGETPTIAGPGFINIRLKTTYVENRLKASRSDLHLGIEKTDTSQFTIYYYW